MPSAAQPSALAPARPEDHLFALEERFWTEGAEYYEGNLVATAVMVFPDLLKDEIASSLGAATRWAYKATALRPGAEPRPPEPGGVRG